ncbi:MAG: general secretion pathway protein GspB [Pseudomonadota bacterium]
MSLILDALARAERDKQRAAASLPEMLQDAATEPRARNYRLWIAIAVLLAVIAVLVVLYLRAARPAAELSPASPARGARTETPTMPSRAESVPIAPARSASPLAGAPASAGDTPQRQVGPGEVGAPGTAPGERNERENRAAAQSVAALYAQSAAEPGSPDPVDRGRNDASTSGATASVPGPRDSPTVGGELAVAEAPSVPPGRAAVAPSAPVDAPVSAELIEESVDIEAVLRDVRAEARAGGLQPHRAPLLAELSQQFRDEVPTLMYLRHDFNPGGDSTVLMNGETLRVGGRTRGVELREILPQSAVLLFRGQEFRLRALNSWVNL